MIKLCQEQILIIIFLIFLYSQQNKINSAANGTETVESPTKTPLPYIPTYQRTGCMAAFESFAQFEQYFDEILDIMEDLSTPVYVSPKIIEALESGSESRLSSSLNVSLSLGDTRTPDQDNLQVIIFVNCCNLQLKKY